MRASESGNSLAPASASVKTGLGTLRSVGAVVMRSPLYVESQADVAARRFTAGLAFLACSSLFAGVAGGGELVVVDALLGHAENFEQGQCRLDHRRRPADVGVGVLELGLVPLHHVGDEAGLALPLVALGRLGQRGHITEVRQRAFQPAQFFLEAQVPAAPGA